MRGQVTRVQPNASGNTTLAWSRSDALCLSGTFVTDASGRLSIPNPLGLSGTAMATTCMVTDGGGATHYLAFLVSVTTTIITVQLWTLANAAAASGRSVGVNVICMALV